MDQVNCSSGPVSTLVNSGSGISADVRRAAKRQLNGSCTELEPAIKQEKTDTGYDQAAANQTATPSGTVLPTTSVEIPIPVSLFCSSEPLTQYQTGRRRGRPPRQLSCGRQKKTAQTVGVNGHNDRVLHRPVILRPRGGSAASYRGSFPSYVPSGSTATPNAVRMSTWASAAAVSTSAPIVVLVSRSSTAARIVWTGLTSTSTATSSVFTRPVRLPSTSQSTNIHAGSSPLDRLKATIGRSVLDKYVGPHEPPSELHMPVRSRHVCRSCGDQFVTNVGLVDHVSRRSMVISFRCVCNLSRWPRLFYNPCMFESFYWMHISRPGMHASRDSVVISALDLDTPEYRSCLEAWNRRKDAAAACEKEVGRSSENANSQHVATANTDSRHVPAETPVKEIYVNVEIMSTSRGDKRAVPAENAAKGTTTAVVKRKTSKNCVAKPASVAENRSSVKRRRQRSELPADSSLLAKVSDFYKALCHNRVKCQECKVEYRTRRWLKSHFSVSRTQSPLECTDCGLMLPTVCSLNAHSRMHENRRPLVCPHCGILFDEAESVEVFKSHVERHCFHVIRSSSGTTASSKCPRCSFNLPDVDEAEMARHFVDTHASVYYKCRSCPKAFVNESAADRHSENAGHDARKDIVRKCPSCDTVFKDGVGDDMHSHVLEHLSTVSRTMLHCPCCPEQLSRRSSVIEHMRSSHPDEILPATTCEVCGQPYPVPEELFTHVSTQHVDYFESVMKCLPSAIEKMPSSNTEGEPRLQNGSLPDTSTVTIAEPASVEDPEVLSSSSSTEAPSTAAVSNTESASVSSEVFECDRCQVKFTSEAMYKRHQAKHRFLASKKASKKSQSVAKSSSDPTQQVLALLITFLIFYSA